MFKTAVGIAAMMKILLTFYVTETLVTTMSQVSRNVDKMERALTVLFQCV